MTLDASFLFSMFQSFLGDDMNLVKHNGNRKGRKTISQTQRYLQKSDLFLQDFNMYGGVKTLKR